MSNTKGKFVLNFPRAISEFENAMQKFPVKKILYKNIFMGKGLEFDSYRVFEPTDDASFIDWKASLRANEILAKKYIEERDLHVYFLVDVSASMLFGSGDKLKAEFAAEFVASLSHLVLGSGDNIGLVLFNDKVVRMLRAARSKNQFGLFTKYLGDSDLYGGGFDVGRAVDHVLGAVKTPYTVFIIVSDFIRMKEKDFDSLRLMGTRFETLAVMVRDKLDEDLPDSNYQFAVRDPYSGRQMILDPEVARERFRRNVRRQKEMVKDMFVRSRIDFLELRADKNFTVALANFLRGRARGSRV